jgi:adenylate cyclase
MVMIVEPFDEQDLAARVGTGVDAIRRLAGLGLLRADGSGAEPGRLALRARVILQLEASGVSLDDLARAVGDGSLALDFIDGQFGGLVPMRHETHSDLFRRLGLTVADGNELLATLGLPMLPADEPVREDDAEYLEIYVRTVGLGIPAASLRRLARAYADLLRRVVGVEWEFWREGVERPVLEQGGTYQEMFRRTASMANQLSDTGERLLLLIHNRYLEQRTFQNVAENLEVAMEQAGIHRRADRVDPAVAFLDLSGFTRMTEEAGDEAAAEDADRFAQLVRKAAAKNGGGVVKLLGDGAMLHFATPLDAVRCGLELVEAVPAAHLPPARVGVDTGPLILRDGDFYGRTVNIAARLTDYARPREVLVTSGVVEATSDAGGVVFTEIGPVSLKGVAQPVPIWSAALRGP